MQRLHEIGEEREAIGDSAQGGGTASTDACKEQNNVEGGHVHKRRKIPPFTQHARDIGSNDCRAPTQNRDHVILSRKIVDNH
jgi:hypothetical protein